MQTDCGGDCPLRGTEIGGSVLKTTDQSRIMPPASAVSKSAPSAAPRRKRFVFLLLDRFTMLSFAGAIEPLRIANRVLGFQAYTWVLAGENGTEATCSNGASFRLDMGLEEITREDTVLVCGGIDVQDATSKPILNWLRREARRGAAGFAPAPIPSPRRGFWTASARPSTGKTRTASLRSSRM
jgi:hypothetical protein